MDHVPSRVAEAFNAASSSGTSPRSSPRWGRHRRGTARLTVLVPGDQYGRRHDRDGSRQRGNRLRCASSWAIRRRSSGTGSSRRSRRSSPIGGGCSSCSAPGWGKSAVYFVTTALLRARGAGPTLLVSPLLGLMRNQIEAAERGGLRAATINSDNQKLWDEVIGELEANTVDVLLVSPERFANQAFRERRAPDDRATRRAARHRRGALHQRLGPRLPARLPPARPRPRSPPPRRPRARHDRHRERPGRRRRPGAARRGAPHHPRPARPREPRPRRHRAALPTRPARLARAGAAHAARHRHRLHAHRRRRAPRRRVAALPAASRPAPTPARPTPRRSSPSSPTSWPTTIKAVVATSALGMGYDKPDLAFVVHYQSPGSADRLLPAGRPGRPWHRPRRGHPARRPRGPPTSRTTSSAPRSPSASRPKPSSRSSPTRRTGCRCTRSRTTSTSAAAGSSRMLKNLEVDGAVEREGRKYRRTLAPWTYDEDRVELVTAQRRHEQETMRDYLHGTGCLMETLRHELDDPVGQAVRSLQPLHRRVAHDRARPVARDRGAGVPPRPEPRAQAAQAVPGGHAHRRGRAARRRLGARPLGRRRLGPADRRRQGRRHVLRRARRRARRAARQAASGPGVRVGHRGAVPTGAGARALVGRAARASGSGSRSDP